MWNSLLLLFACFSCKTTLTSCEVLLVNRNVTDSFRLGKEGCKNDASVCPKWSASCETESGLCFCHHDQPNFRNPSTKFGDGEVYGCLNNTTILAGVGGTFNCSLGPFQLVSYSHKDPATQFSMIQDRNTTLQNCSLRNALAKFPNNATYIDLPWLNDSYVHFTVNNTTLLFKWKKSVPDLRGTIITLRLSCRQKSGSFYSSCLRAKVIGTWSPEVITRLKVVWVHRNVTDSFRVGEDGCTSDTSICPRSASCQNDSGLCLCGKDEPNFRNPFGNSDDDQVYGCLNSTTMLADVGRSFKCPLGPFQLVPYSHEDPATQFSNLKNTNTTFQNCSLREALVKCPGNAADMELPWLNASFVNFTVNNTTLLFKWKRSVPGLRGTIITLRLRCRQASRLHYSSCLRAKVYGEWRSDAISSVSSEYACLVKPTSGVPWLVNSTVNATIASTTSAPISIVTNLIIFGIFLLFVFAVGFLCFLAVVLCKRECKGSCRWRKRNSERRSSYEDQYGRRNVTSTDRYNREASIFENVAVKGRSQDYGGRTNLANATSKWKSADCETKSSHEASKKQEKMKKNDLQENREVASLDVFKIETSSYQTPRSDLKKEESKKTMKSCSRSDPTLHTKPGVSNSKMNDDKNNDITTSKTSGRPDSKERRTDAYENTMARGRIQDSGAKTNLAYATSNRKSVDVKTSVPGCQAASTKQEKYNEYGSQGDRSFAPLDVNKVKGNDDSLYLNPGSERKEAMPPCYRWGHILDAKPGVNRSKMNDNKNNDITKSKKSSRPDSKEQRTDAYENKTARGKDENGRANTNLSHATSNGESVDMKTRVPAYEAASTKQDQYSPQGNRPCASLDSNKVKGNDDCLYSKTGSERRKTMPSFYRWEPDVKNSILSDGKKNDITDTKKSKNQNDNKRRDDAYENMAVRERNEDGGAKTNYGYATSNRKSVDVQGNVPACPEPDYEPKKTRQSYYRWSLPN